VKMKFSRDVCSTNEAVPGMFRPDSWSSCW
jgi:hypothetical protein